MDTRPVAQAFAFALALPFTMLLAQPSAATNLDHTASKAPETKDDGDDDQFSVMQVLSDAGKHDREHERWSAYGQFTYISSWKAPFSAAYTNLNGSNHSLLPDSEHSFTATATLFLGVALWRGAEVYLVPEMISSRPLSSAGRAPGVSGRSSV